jgi:hypothetical protein
MSMGACRRNPFLADYTEQQLADVDATVIRSVYCPHSFLIDYVTTYSFFIVYFSSAPRVLLAHNIERHLLLLLLRVVGLGVRREAARAEPAGRLAFKVVIMVR